MDTKSQRGRLGDYEELTPSEYRRLRELSLDPDQFQLDFECRVKSNYERHKSLLWMLLVCVILPFLNTITTTILSQAGAFYILISQKCEHDQIVTFTDLLRNIGSDVHLSSMSTLATWNAVETFLSPEFSARETVQLRHIKVDPGTTLELSFASQQLIGFNRLFDLYNRYPCIPPHIYTSRVNPALQEHHCNRSRFLVKSIPYLNKTYLYDLCFRAEVTELRERSLLNHHEVTRTKSNEKESLAYGDFRALAHHLSLGQKQTLREQLGLGTVNRDLLDFPCEYEICSTIVDLVDSTIRSDTILRAGSVFTLQDLQNLRQEVEQSYGIGLRLLPFLHYNATPYFDALFGANLQNFGENALSDMIGVWEVWTDVLGISKDLLDHCIQTSTPLPVRLRKLLWGLLKRHWIALPFVATVWSMLFLIDMFLTASWTQNHSRAIGLATQRAIRQATRRATWRAIRQTLCTDSFHIFSTLQELRLSALSWTQSFIELEFRISSTLQGLRSTVLIRTKTFTNDVSGSIESVLTPRFSLTAAIWGQGTNSHISGLEEQLFTITFNERVQNEWQSEVCIDIPFSLTGLYSILTRVKLSYKDRFQNALERYSGEEWLWRPWTPPRKPLAIGRVRLKWKCSCGSEQSIDISRRLAATLRLSTIVSRSRGQPHKSSNKRRPAYQASNPLASTNLRLQPLPPIPGSHKAPLPSTSTSRAQRQVPDPLGYGYWVLLCVPRRSRVRAQAIEMSPGITDEAFFGKFKSTYISLRGRFRYYLDPRQFAFCHATKFEKYHVDRLGTVCHEMPPFEEAAYSYNPKPYYRPYRPPLTKHEWQDRFYNLLPRAYCIKTEALSKLPKRSLRFNLQTHISRETIWGLHAQLRISAAMVAAWQFSITIGGWIFVGWWLKDHPSDLQNASVPITLIIGTMMLLWLPLGEKFKDES